MGVTVSLLSWGTAPRPAPSPAPGQVPARAIPPWTPGRRIPPVPALHALSLCAILAAVPQGWLWQGTDLPKLSPKSATSDLSPWGVWAKVTAVASCQRW